MGRTTNVVSSVSYGNISFPPFPITMTCVKGNGEPNREYSFLVTIFLGYRNRVEKSLLAQ